MSNLFDLSASSSPKKKPGKKMFPLRKKLPTPTIKDQEIEEIFSKISQMSGELKEQVRKAFEKSGKTPEELANFCKNPAHFTKEQWKHFQERKDVMEAKIFGISQEDLQKKRREKEEKQSVKGRKGKTLGARKKWIDMR